MDQQQTETARKQPKYYPKTLQAMRLVEMGMEAKEALKAVNYTNKISGQAVSEFKNKLKKHSLQAPQIVKLAHHAIKDCLTDQPIIQRKKDEEGNEIIQEIAPTWTNKIAASAMVMDRYEPVINKSQSLNVNVDVSPVDLSKWLNGPIPMQATCQGQGPKEQ